MSSAARPHSQVYGPQKPTAEDERVQEAVLEHLLELYPAQPTIAEVVRELTVASSIFTVLDQVELAIRELIRMGLIHRHGDCLVASRAAVHGESIRL